MADHIHIENLSPYDGDWPFDIATVTNREFHIIKTITGARANEIVPALEAGDNDMAVAFAEIALTRAGLRVNRDRLWDAPVGAIQLVLEEEEEVTPDSPPASAPPTEPRSKPDDASENRSSGSRSTNGGDPQAKDPSRIGTPA